MEPRLLIIETSSRAGLAAVAAGSEVRGLRRLDEARHHARDLAPAVAELLAAQAWRARELQGVIVSRGPGSYTGLRVGIMSARTLAYATGCALLGVETFTAIALQAPACVDRLAVLADAQQERIYVQEFRRPSSGEDLQPAGPLAIRPFAAWLAQWTAGAWVSGPGLQSYGNRLSAGDLMVDRSLWYPQAESLLKIGLKRYQAGERDDIWTLEPLYLRPSAAEEKLSRSP